MKKTTLSYQSFFWKVGTTSFRKENHNYAIERLLKLLQNFWLMDRYCNEGWEHKNPTDLYDIYQIKNEFYEYLQLNNFVSGNDKVKYKAAREITSGLVDIGLIDNERRLTEVGKIILDYSDKNDFKPDNFLNLPKDRFVYLKQLLKTEYKIKEKIVRPLPLLIYFLTVFKKLSYDEFCYLVPLCISEDNLNTLVNRIGEVRNNKTDIDNVILSFILKQDNYKVAKSLFLKAVDVSEDLICKIGINRKSKNNDKIYYSLYKELCSVFIKKDNSAIGKLFDVVKELQTKAYWKKLLFKQNVRTSKKISKDSLNDSVFNKCKNEKELREYFFNYLHLYKNKKTLDDYADLNRRYLSLSGIFLFQNNEISLDTFPYYYFCARETALKNLAFSHDENLIKNVKLSDIEPALIEDIPSIINGINRDYKRNISTLEEAFSINEETRYERLNKLIDDKFSDDVLLTLLDCFEKRIDNTISKTVTENADIPTIFEYILGIIWYKISDRKGRLLDYMKLSLDPDLLPITHACGGEADIVYFYNESEDYPEHSVLLEATLATSGQRHMEMEPVSRHLGNNIIITKNQANYAIFVSTELDLNVVNDFLGRKFFGYYDKDNNSRVNLKIIPIDTEELKKMIRNKVKYKSIYKHYQNAFTSLEQEFTPDFWLNELIRLK